MNLIPSFPRIGFSTNVFDNPADVVQTVRRILEHFRDIEIEIEDESEAEIFTSDDQKYHRLVRELCRALSEKARQISVHSPYLSADTNLAATDEVLRQHAVEWVKKSIRFCAEIGGNLLTYHPGFTAPGQDKKKLTEQLKRSIDSMQGEASKWNVKLCLENMGKGRPKYLVYSPEEHLALHRTTGTWVTLDLVHLASWCADLSEVDSHLAAYAPVTANIHLNDMPADRHQHLPLGEGTLPVSYMLRRMAELGYQGAAIVDEFTRPIPAELYVQRTLRFVAELQRREQPLFSGTGV